jgi:tRNA pseudouridine38-40 synthase
VRIALGLEYDGSGFCGWQTQPSGCAIQDHLENAIERIGGQRVTTVCAGRTDAGVHALIQVVHFDSDAKRPISAWVRGMNTWFPKQIAVQWARPVGEGFNARTSALERRYSYVLLNGPVRPGLFQRKIGWFHRPLDISAMRRAAQFLIGEHDFSAFRSAECNAPSPVRDLRDLRVSKRGELILCEFVANAFLQHMVRNLMGALIEVGSGKRIPEWILEILEGRDRTRGAATFPPDGLYLSGIKYDSAWGLPETGRMPLLIENGVANGTGRETGQK